MRIDPERLRDEFFNDIPALSLGLIRVRRRVLRMGPLPLIRFGLPQPIDGGWSWPITGGLLARRAGGELRFQWTGGCLAGSLTGYRPALPRPIHFATQARVHHLVTRLYLLRLRGPEPPPGRGAEPRRRMLAAAIDGAAVAACALALRRRKGGSAAAAAAGLAYLLCGWTGGGTLGQRLAGLRLLAWDGSRPTWEQAVLRLASVPPALIAGRPLHDAAACTVQLRG